MLKARLAAFDESHRNPFPAPKTGSINNLVIFIRFSGESEYTNAISGYDSNFNSGAGSMANYFKEASYNALTVNTYFYPDRTGSTVVSYQDANTRNYYRPYNATTNPTGYSGRIERDRKAGPGTYALEERRQFLQRADRRRRPQSRRRRRWIGGQRLFHRLWHRLMLGTISSGLTCGRSTVRPP